MKKTLTLLLLAACGLLMTACYTDNDPWSKAVLNSTSAPTPVVTASPATAVPHTQQPAATATPLPEDSVDVSPNFNG